MKPATAAMSQHEFTAGVDEVGRGTWAGPVTAAAVILPRDHGIQGLNDSKKLSPEKRERLVPQIKAVATAWAVANVSAEDIDRLNILQATLLAMQRAVSQLSVQPTLVQVDGNHPPKLNCAVETIVGGDGKIAAIMAASILAKVARDNEMQQQALQHPGYGFEQHKGYGTPEHSQALARLGPCVLHRRSFAPVARCCSR